MATIIGGGLMLANPEAAEPKADKAELTPEEQMSTLVITRLRQGHAKAALAAALDLVSLIKLTHDL